ncbi:unnamed protein product, partial [Amoebophrya sp. A120]|eukprot:GSA120T00019308001.1
MAHLPVPFSVLFSRSSFVMLVPSSLPKGKHPSTSTSHPRPRRTRAGKLLLFLLHSLFAISPVIYFNFAPFSAASASYLNIEDQDNGPTLEPSSSSSRARVLLPLPSRSSFLPSSPGSNARRSTAKASESADEAGARSIDFLSGTTGTRSTSTSHRDNDARKGGIVSSCSSAAVPLLSSTVTAADEPLLGSCATG